MNEENNNQYTKHQKIAMQLFEESGYNDAQAILVAFMDETKLDLDTSLKMGLPLGAGMGRMREVCGALTGIFIVAGIKYASVDVKDKEAKDNHYTLIQNLAGKFKEKEGSIICRDLLKLSTAGASNPVSDARTAEYYAQRPCTRLVGLAAKILDEYIEEQEKKD